MANLKSYPKYKNSGIEWIKKIPEHWNVNKLKFLSNVQVSNVDKKSVDEEIPVLLCNYVDVYYNDKITSEIDFMKATAKDEQIKRFMLRKDDVLITKDSESPNDIAVPAWVQEDLEGVLCGYHLAHIRPNSTVMNGRYLYYSFESSGIKEQFWVNANGITRFGLSKDSINNALFLVPPIDEQKQIADFLDEKISEIGSLIADKEKLIELLEEKRQVIITEAVSKGLNPNVKMKDSGVEWIGEIPEHWGVRPLFTIFSESKVKNIGNREQNVLSLSYGKIVRRDVETNFGLLPESFETYQIVEPGNIILRLTDLQNDKRSLRCGLVKEKGIITSAYVALKANSQINEVYAYYLLHGYDLLKVFYGMGNGVRQSMGFADLKRVPILLPPKEEQNMIAKYLDKEINQLELLISEIKTQIQKLKEYRQSLIYEVVTGKIDVRDFVKV
jgi:type I restriction enzyme S subunit